MKYLKLIFTGIGWVLDRLSKAFGFHGATKRVLLAFVLYSCLAAIRSDRDNPDRSKGPGTKRGPEGKQNLVHRPGRSATPRNPSFISPVVGHKEKQCWRAHRLAKAKHPHYGIIPLPVGTVAGHSTGGN